MKRVVAVMAIGAIGSASWYVGSGLVQNVRYARAVEQVELSREQLSKLEDFAGVFKSVGKAVEPSVVLIEVTKKASRQNSDVRRQLPFDDDMLRRFFPDNDGDGEPDLPDSGGSFDQQGQGSGVIMEADGKSGWILTNNHVAGDSDEIKVTLHDGREIKGAKLLGADPKTDLAVVKIEASNLIAARWGDSDRLEKGDIVMAFGAPFGYVGSMTHGIVSALNRQAGILGQSGYENFIQVDCPINPGNSGGPLVNTLGEVVGINTAILSRNGGFQGVGFSIPSNQAKFVYAQLKDDGKVTRGWLGVSISDLSRQPDLATSFGFVGTKGVLVNEVLDGPAADSLRDGDIITAINGRPTDTMNQLRNTVATLAPGAEVKLKVFRDRKDIEVTLKIGEQPANVQIAGRRSGGPRDGAADPAGATTAEKLGVKLADPTAAQLQRFGLDAETGALITAVTRNSPAGKQNLRIGDLITRINDIEVTDAKSAIDALSGQDLSKGIRMQISSRDGKRFVFVRQE